MYACVCIEGGGGGCTGGKFSVREIPLSVCHSYLHGLHDGCAANNMQAADQATIKERNKKRENALRWRRARSCVQCLWLSKYEYLRTSLEGACNTVVPDWPWPLSTLDARRGAKRLTSNVTAPRSGRRKSGPTSCRWSSCGWRWVFSSPGTGDVDLEVQ